MKKLEGFTIFVGVGIACLLLMAAASRNVWVGAFVGDGTGLTNVSGSAAAAVAAGTNIVVGTNSGVATVSVSDPLAVNALNLGTVTVTNALLTTLAPTSAQTNYTVALGGFPNVSVIYMANTNAWLTFTGTNSPGYQSTVAFRAVTNSIVTRFTVNLPSFMTNVNLNYYVTNNSVKFVNFYNLDATGTNLVVSDAGTAPHN